MQTNLYRQILLKCVPFIRFTTYYTSMRGKQYHDGYKFLRPGQIILTVDKKKLTSLLIPGQMTHAALCVFKRAPYDQLLSVNAFEVAEMTHSDFTRSDFFDICKESDRVVLMQCLDWDHDYTRRVIDACLGFQGATYDVEFDLGVKALYCSELIYQADWHADHAERWYKMHLEELLGGGKFGRLQVDLSDLAGLGREYLSPDGLLFAKNVRCVWDSEGKWQGLLGPEIEKLTTTSR